VDYEHQNFPAWRYGPNGQSQIFQSESEVPKGWEDHPSKVGGKAGGGTQTARASANGKVSEAEAAKTTTATSQTALDPAIAANNTGGGTDPTVGQSQPATTDTNAGAAGDTGSKAKDEIDAHGHTWDEKLHAATKSKTKDGLWRMRPGIARPPAKKGYPLDL
jgi:hypothetical protein